MFIVAGISAVAAAVCGVLGFVILPKRNPKPRVRRRGRGKAAAAGPTGLARSLFIVFAAGAFVAGFFGMFMPG